MSVIVKLLLHSLTIAHTYIALLLEPFSILILYVGVVTYYNDEHVQYLLSIT